MSPDTSMNCIVVVPICSGTGATKFRIWVQRPAKLKGTDKVLFPFRSHITAEKGRFLQGSICKFGNKWPIFCLKKPQFDDSTCKVWNIFCPDCGPNVEECSDFWQKMGQFGRYYTLKTAYFYSNLASIREMDLVCPF